MDRTRRDRRLAAARGIASRIYARRFPRLLGAHLAAFLIALPLAAQDIAFNPAITQAEFSKFSRLIGQGIFATPVAPARSSGLLRFDVGIAATALKIDTSSPYWQHSVPAGSDFVHGSYAAVPRLVATKGLGAMTISASYAKFSNSGVKTYGGAIDLPVIRGTIATPELVGMLREHRLKSPDGQDAIDILIRRMQASFASGGGVSVPPTGYQRTSSKLP